MIAVERHEDLAFVREAAKGRGVQDAVAVALELATRRRRGLGMEPAARARGVAGVGREGQPERQLETPVIERAQLRPYDMGD
jgi:hypothetical protein